MRTLCGTARRVRLGAEVAGNKYGIDTAHVVTFRLGNHAVQLTTPRMADIADGDEVVVAGDVVNGTLVGRAYRNLSTGSHGRVTKRFLIGLAAFYATFSALFYMPFAILLMPMLVVFGGLTPSTATVVYGAGWSLLLTRGVLNELKSRWAYGRVRWGRFEGRHMECV